MIVINIKDTVALDGYYEFIMPIEYPDHDTQGIINNAHIATLVETACEMFLLKFNKSTNSFIESLIRYSVIFNKGIPFQLNAEKLFEPVLPMIRVRWNNSNSILVKVVNSEDKFTVFSELELEFNWNIKFHIIPEKLDIPEKTGVHHYTIFPRANNINRFGFYHLSRICTFLESTHLWFFGQGFLKTNWIRCPLPIIVKKIDLRFFRKITEDIKPHCLLRIADTKGVSSIKFWIDIVDESAQDVVYARAFLVVVYVHPDPRDWTSAHTEAIPQQVRKKIEDFYLGIT